MIIGFTGVERSDFGDAVAIGFRSCQKPLGISIPGLRIIIFDAECLPDRHIALRRRAVSVKGRNVKLKRQPLDDPAALDQIDVNLLFSDAQVEAALFGSARGRIGQIGRVAQVAEASIRSGLEVFVPFREIDAGDEAPAFVEIAFVLLALFSLPFLLTVIPAAFGLARDAYATTFDRLAE